MTLSWSFQMVAFQISSEKQVCSANPPRSAICRPSHQVNFVPPACFTCLLVVGSRCRCLFFVVQALALRWPGFSHKPIISFWFHVPQLWVNTPTTEAKYKNKESIHLKKFFAPLHKQESRDRAGLPCYAQKMCALAIGATVFKVLKRAL